MSLADTGKGGVPVGWRRSHCLRCRVVSHVRRPEVAALPPRPCKHPDPQKSTQTDFGAKVSETIRSSAYSPASRLK